MFAAGGLAHAGLAAKAAGNEIAAKGYSNGAVGMIFLFTATFGATWLTVPWLYPAEIFPLEVRAKGNAWGVVGWSLGNGWLTLVLPVIFKALGEKTYYIFGFANVSYVSAATCAITNVETARSSQYPWCTVSIPSPINAHLKR